MKIQVILNNSTSPILFNKAKGLIISNKTGAKIIGTDYTRIYPLESLQSVMVVDNDT